MDSSISELRYLASRTIFNDSPLARIITGLIKVFPFSCSSCFTGDIISYFSRMSSNLLTLSCKLIGTLFALYFLKTASGFKGKCSGEFIFPTSNLDVTQTFGYFKIKSANFSNSFCVNWEC